MGSHPLHAPANDVLVLAYHAVSDDWASDLAVSTDALRRQLTTLVRRGYRGATFADALTGSRDGKIVVATFDDAYRSVLEHALPILASLELPGTVFVPTRFANGDQLASWSGVDVYLNTSSEHELAVMGWDELRELTARGWEIGSHTCSHPRLTEIDDERLERELAESKQECESQLGVPCRTVAYPYGATDARVIAATGKAGYAGAAGLPLAQRLHAPTALNWPRIGIFLGDGSIRFAAKVSRISRRLRTRSG